MRSLNAGMKTEGGRILRSPLRLVLLLAPFLAWGICVGVYAQRLPRQLHAGLVDQDHSTLSRTLLRDFASAPVLQIQTYPDLATLQAALRAGEIRCGIVIPRGTDEEVREGRTAHIVSLRDATRSIPATQIFQAVSTVVATEGARLSAARLMRVGLPASAAKDLALPLRLDGRPLGNPWMDYLRSFAPVLLPMFLQLGLMVAGASCATGSRHSSIRMRMGRILSWIVPSALAGGIIQVLLADTWGAGLASAAATTILCLASGFLGLGIGRVVGDPQRTVQALLVFNTPAFVLSGFTFPEWAMPRLLDTLTRPLPFSLWYDIAQATAGAADGHLARGVAGLCAWLALGLLLCLPWKNRKPHRKPHAPQTPAEAQSISAPAKPASRSKILDLLRIPGIATMLLLGPPGYFLLYGSVYADKEETRVPIAVVAGSNTAQTRSLVENLAAHPRLEARLELPTQAMDDLRSGAVHAVVQIPRDLDQRMRDGHSVSIPMLVHADRFLVASDLQRAVSEVATDAGNRIRARFVGVGQNPSRARELSVALMLEDHPLGNPRETYGDYMLPILGLLIAHQLILVASGVVAAQRHFDGSSLGKSIGQILAIWAWFSLAAGAWLVVGLRFYQVPLHPDFWAVAVCVPLGLLGAAGLGATLGRLCGHPLWHLRLAAFTSYPLFFLSGASWPLEAMPAPLRILSFLDPLAPLLDGADRALRLGAGLGEIAPALLHALLVSGIWLSLAAVIGTGARRWFDKKTTENTVVAPETVTRTGADPAPDAVIGLARSSDDEGGGCVPPKVA